MLASGNGRPEQCALNLLRITRGEVPYDRIRGRDGVLTDSPTSSVIDDAAADAEWLLHTYEPRVQLDGVDIYGTLSDIGEFGIHARLKRKDDN